MKTNDNKILFYDSCCGEPVEWIKDGIHHRLSRMEAVEKYGKISEIEVGPRGGYKSITFGNTKFMSRFAI